MVRTLLCYFQHECRKRFTKAELQLFLAPWGTDPSYQFGIYVNEETRRITRREQLVLPPFWEFGGFSMCECACDDVMNPPPRLAYRRRRNFKEFRVAAQVSWRRSCHQYLIYILEVVDSTGDITSINAYP